MEGFCEITYYDNSVPSAPKWVTGDAWSSYRIAFEKGTYKELFSLPTPKEPYIYDWGGSDGLEVDEESPVILAARSLTLPIVVIAKDEADFWSRYNGFRNLIYSHRVIEYHFLKTGYRFKLRFTGGGDLTILGTIRGSGQKAMRFNLTFSDDYPRILPLLPASVFDDEMTFDIILD